MKPLTPKQVRMAMTAMQALYAPPLSEAEKREHAAAVARQRHRDELLRAPSPQLELDESEVTRG